MKNVFRIAVRDERIKLDFEQSILQLKSTIIYLIFVFSRVYKKFNNSQSPYLFSTELKIKKKKKRV